MDAAQIAAKLIEQFEACSAASRIYAGADEHSRQPGRTWEAENAWNQRACDALLAANESGREAADLAEQLAARPEAAGIAKPLRTLANRLLGRDRSGPADDVWPDLLADLQAVAAGATGPAAEAVEPPPRLIVDLENSVVTLDGQRIACTQEQAWLIHHLNEAGGGIVSGTDMKNHPTRPVGRSKEVRKNLPEPLQGIVRSVQSKGFRLEL